MNVNEDTLANTAEVRMILDDVTGKPIADILCPVACGDCCKYWVHLREFNHYIVEATIWKKKCPMLRKHGCRLKRTKMPDICKLYLCELGMLAYYGLVTKEEIARAVAIGAQDFACAELHKTLPTQQTQTVDMAEFFPELY